MTDLGLRPLVPTLHQLAESAVFDDRNNRLLY
jgi:hypothetical protein